MHSFFIVELSHRQLPQSIQNRERMRWIAGKVKIYLMRFKEGTVDGIGIGIQAAADGINAAKDEQPRLGDSVVADLRGTSHVDSDRSRDDNAVGVTR